MGDVVIRSPMPSRKTPIRPSAKRMKASRGKRATVADSKRWNDMCEIGCIACRQRKAAWGATGMNVEMHHLLSGGRRIGHHATIALCHWHHQAKRFPSTTSGYTDQAKLYGPSLEREPRRFHEMYGDDESLLAMQNELIRTLRIQR